MRRDGRQGTRGDVRSGTREREIRDAGREIGDAGTRGRGDAGTQNRKCGLYSRNAGKVAINSSKKLISSKEAGQTSAIFLSILIDLPIKENTYLHAFG